MSGYNWYSDAARRSRREGAVSDVLDGMSMTGAAVLWDVQVDDLRRWVDDARVNGQDES